MANETEKRKLLSTWKDIANYLDCGVRTCHRWEEKYELPIHRIEEGTSTRVFAFQDELDSWLAKRSDIKAQHSYESAGKFLKIKTLFIFFAIFIMGTLIIYLVWQTARQNSNPAGFRIENSSIILTDAEGKKLGEYSAQVENLVEEEIYKAHFQVKRNAPEVNSRVLPYILMKDLDNDGRTEVLFSVHTTTGYGGGLVVCLDQGGRELWSFHGGRELIIGTKNYTDDYRIHGIEVRDLNEDGNQEIIVISDQTPDFPTQLAVLDHNGDTVGEYWNMGRIMDLVFVDLDQNGTKEIIAGSMNNEIEKPCLFVLDIQHVEGCSPQLDENYRSDELGPGTEKYYISFPKIDFISREVLMESINKVDILGNGHISARSGISDIFFSFDKRLVLEDITLSHGFKIKHEKALTDGRVTSTFEEQYEKIKNEILYWDGSKWVSAPTMTSYWKNQ